MLRNRLYLGEINHRDQSYPGEHRPIIDSALFDEVQAKLDENLRTRRLKNERSQALLLGKLYDDRGNRMTPSYAIKKGVRYRYYVSCVLAQGRKDEAGSLSRIAAGEIEAIMRDVVAEVLAGSQGSAELDRCGPANSEPHAISTARVPNELGTETLSDRARLERCVDRIIVGARTIEIRLLEDVQTAS